MGKRGAVPSGDPDMDGHHSGGALVGAGGPAPRWGSQWGAASWSACPGRAEGRLPQAGDHGMALPIPGVSSEGTGSLYPGWVRTGVGPVRSGRAVGPSAALSDPPSSWSGPGRVGPSRAESSRAERSRPNRAEPSSPSSALRSCGRWRRGPGRQGAARGRAGPGRVCPRSLPRSPPSLRIGNMAAARD